MQFSTRGNTEQSMVRDMQKLLGRFVVETTESPQQELRVIDDSNMAMFEYGLKSRAAESFWVNQALLLSS